MASKAKSWFRFENKAGEDTTTIYIYDEISLWGITAKDFVAALSEVKTSEIKLRLNSPGGDVFDGITIYNALREHPAKVTTQVDGLAASIASVIAMAGDEIRMSENAFMMIHNAWALIAGNAEDMRKLADTLDKIDATLVKTYQDKTGATQRDLRAMMAAETWLTANDALAKGFCDVIGDPAEVKARFDLSKFANVPHAVAAMNISNEQPTERDIEAILRDSGISKRGAMAAVAAIRGEGVREAHDATEASNLKEFLQMETLKIKLM